VMAWIAKIKATPTGPVALIYKGPPPEDMSQAKTYIQVPVTIETMPEKGEFRILKRRAFPLVYAKYEGPVAGCHLLFGTVDQWCKDNGYHRTGPWRVQYLSFDPKTGQCTAEVGYPARK